MKKFLLTILTLVFTIGVNSQVVQTWNWTANQGQSADFEKAVADKTKKYNSSKDGAPIRWHSSTTISSSVPFNDNNRSIFRCILSALND